LLHNFLLFLLVPPYIRLLRMAEVTQRPSSHTPLGLPSSPPASPASSPRQDQATRGSITPAHTKFAIIQETLRTWVLRRKYLKLSKYREHLDENSLKQKKTLQPLQAMLTRVSLHRKRIWKRAPATKVCFLRVVEERKELLGCVGKCD
jgi:hypothetical protein